MTVGIASEVVDCGVRVNAVRPGLIDTDIHAAAGMPDRVARFGRKMPIGRAGRPEEVAEAIVWLLSDKASYVTGAILNVTGGAR
jgi:NAD(P)-dependent dehydrogenase (short-subunit alcohol dehydrogenase family)